MPRPWLSAMFHSRFCRHHIQHQGHYLKNLKILHLVLTGIFFRVPLHHDLVLVCTKCITKVIISTLNSREPVENATKCTFNSRKFWKFTGTIYRNRSTHHYDELETTGREYTMTDEQKSTN